ncbi:hypothetical protein ACVWYG_000964 [Pedobacter sp. UYEF25]
MFYEANQDFLFQNGLSLAFFKHLRQNSLFLFLFIEHKFYTVFAGIVIKFLITMYIG